MQSRTVHINMNHFTRGTVLATGYYSLSASVAFGQSLRWPLRYAFRTFVITGVSTLISFHFPSEIPCVRQLKACDAFVFPTDFYFPFRKDETCPDPWHSHFFSRACSLLHFIQKLHLTLSLICRVPAGPSMSLILCCFLPVISAVLSTTILSKSCSLPTN